MSECAKCVVLVPANYGIEPECERSLVQLEERGYPVWRILGFASIDQCRSQLATDALAQGFEELVWIDADMAFSPDSVDRLRARELPLVSGLYPKKSVRALASQLLSGTKEVVFGQSGGVIEILYAATGFLHTRREVYETIHRRLSLPVCNAQWGKPTVPYFMPMVIQTERGPWYLGEDFSFSHRAREAGYTIYADTTIRLGHIGRYPFSWEDAGGSNQRFATYSYRVANAKE